MISTRNLSALPEIETLRKLTQSLAMLDAIIMPDWTARYYSFNSKWDQDEQMASMRNGEGDAWFCVFGRPGAFLKGFDHESEMSPWNMEVSEVWPGVLDSLPEDFNAFAVEPAFSMQDTTFCIWRSIRDTQWRVGRVSYPDGEDPDGSAWMLSILDGDPTAYKAWAEAYYEHPISLSGIHQVYGHVPLTEELARELNSSVGLKDLISDAKEIDYPIATT